MKNTNYAVLNFGKYSGQAVEKLEDEDYLKFLAKPNYTSGYYKSLHSTELNWKVPFDVKVAARKELDRRGWILKGEHWER